MTSASPNPLWVLKKAVLVYALDFDVSCYARLRVTHDKATNHGSLSLRITVDLAKLTGRSQVLTFNVPPEIIETCSLARVSNEDLCPSGLVSMLQAPVNNVSAVSTLSLELNSTGIVLCPSAIEPISPANQGDLDFHAFARICQSKSLRLHFSRRQFVKRELDQLETFSCALRKRSLQAESFDYARHGVVQRDWRALSLSLDPPPYYEEAAPAQVKQVDPPLNCEESVSEQMVGKRRRDSQSPDDTGRKRLLLPSPQLLDSPTEVNTLSTLSPSPGSIRPTCFTHASSPVRKRPDKLARLKHELRGVSDDLICELLIRSGRQHLLAIPEGVTRDMPSESGEVSFGKVDGIERRLQRYVDTMIDRRLKSRVVDAIIDNAVSECRDQFYDECKTNEAEFHEQVDDGKSEVRDTANECMKEMKEQTQQCIYEIEEQAQRYMHDIEDRGTEVEMSARETLAKLKQWFNAPIQSLLDSKFKPSPELVTNTGRSSSI